MPTNSHLAVYSALAASESRGPSEEELHGYFGLTLGICMCGLDLAFVTISSTIPCWRMVTHGWLEKSIATPR